MKINTVHHNEKIIDEHLILFIEIIDQLKTDYRENKKDIDNLILNYNPKDDDFISLGWCYLYELPPIATFLLYCRHIGMNDALTSINTSETPNLDLLKLNDDDSLIDSLDFKDTPINRTILAMFIHVFMSNITCVKRNNHHMYELIVKGRNGDDTSFFNAIRIDHTVMQTPSFIHRFEKASIKNDKKFFKGLRNSLKNLGFKRWNFYDNTRLVAKLFQEADQLDSKSIDELYEIFCDKFSLYPTTGKDPAKGLHQFILRFRKSVST